MLVVDCDDLLENTVILQFADVEFVCVVFILRVR